MSNIEEKAGNEVETSFPGMTYNCLKFPDCGWIAVNNVPESVVSHDVRDVTVEVEYYWINPGADGWIIIRSNGPGGVEQFAGNDINTHKEFFRANEWATWTLRLTNAHFGTRADGTDLFLFFGADPSDECYIRSVKVYQTATPEKFAVFGATELDCSTKLELNTQNRESSFFVFDPASLASERLSGPTHWHGGVEVIFGQTDGFLTVDGEPLTYSAGDVLFINPDQVRTDTAAIEGACYYLMFDLAMLETDWQNSVLTDLRLKRRQFTTKVPTDHPANGALQEHCRALIDAYSSDSPYKEMKIRSLLLSLLYECCERGLIVDTPHGVSVRRMDYIRNAIVYMENHLAETVTVRAIADYVHLSEAHFSRQFKACIGAAPLEHLNHMRVQRAATLLLEGQSVTEAAMEVGVPNVGHFIRLFKRHYGQTPYQWQKVAAQVAK